MGVMMLHLVRIAVPGANAFLIRGARTILVDCGGAAHRDVLCAALAREGLAPSDLTLLLLTHAHAATAGNARWLQQAHRVPVAIHGADAPILATGCDRPHRPVSATAALVGWLDDPHFEPVIPDVVLGHSTPLWRHGVGATAVHTPGHTIGSVSVLCPAGDAIVGDLVMGGWFGVRSHHPARHWFAECPERVARSLALLERLGVERVHPAVGAELAMAEISRTLRIHAADRVGVSPARLRERRLAHVTTRGQLRPI
jgi:glyoxylase-like metal-dependent hydrolase (beta-lactamase superfamily II)